MEELASILVHSRTQAHVFHLGVSGPGSFAAHKALQDYYEEIVDLIDGLVESYQGKNGLIKFKPVSGLDNNCESTNIIAYFEKLVSVVGYLREADDLADSYIQNEIDNVVNLLYSTKYKLTNLQ